MGILKILFMSVLCTCGLIFLYFISKTIPPIIAIVVGLVLGVVLTFAFMKYRAKAIMEEIGTDIVSKMAKQADRPRAFAGFDMTAPEAGNNEEPTPQPKKKAQPIKGKRKR